VILASQQSGTLSWLADSMSSAGGGKPGHIEEALSSFYARLEAFVRELGKITEVQFEPILVHSRETPTHYKWYMGHTRDGSANVWLHEYKPAETRSSGYAQSVHNHRYPMSVLLLAGGYRYARYAVVPLNEARADITVEEVRRVSAGSTYSMEPSEFHSVTAIEDGTVSLMVQGTPVRRYSTSVDAASGRMTRHVPIEFRLNQLRSVLSAACQESV
jgi:hypothetical protein